MSFSGNESVSVVAAMRVKIQQITHHVRPAVPQLPIYYNGYADDKMLSGEMNMTAPENSDSCSSCGLGWRLPVLFGIVLLAIVIGRNRSVREAIRKPQTTSPPQAEAVNERAEKVLLSINYGDGRLQTVTVEWRDGMTVADVLEQEPWIRLVTNGSSQSAFLTALNGVANEGAGGRNWTYTVNGKYADRSFAVYELQPNDHVLWTFAAQK